MKEILDKVKKLDNHLTKLINIAEDLTKIVSDQQERIKLLENNCSHPEIEVTVSQAPMSVEEIKYLADKYKGEEDKEDE